MERFGIRDGVTLLFTGRMSKDKNLDLLLEAYRRLSVRRPNVNLLLVGDGPYIESIRKTMRGYDRVVLTGKLEQSVLPGRLLRARTCSCSPRIADTFGMSVLERRRPADCGRVSEAGGPKEIIIPGETGLVASPKMSTCGWGAGDRVRHRPHGERTWRPTLTCARNPAKTSSYKLQLGPRSCGTRGHESVRIRLEIHMPDYPVIQALFS
jgi:hypothetical protein